MNPNYDTIAETYDERYVQNDYSGIKQALIAFVGVDLNDRVLDVGCGTGHWLRLLDQNGVRVAGVDLSKAMLNCAHVQAPDAMLARARAEDLCWVNNAFERLFCINAFHHFEDKERFLSEARRVLQPGGQMMIVGLDPHTGLDSWYVYEYFEPVLEIDRGRYPATREIREWMRGRQFTDVRTCQVQHLPVRLAARAAIDQGYLDKNGKSQLAVLTDQDYQRGVDRIYAALARAETQGEYLYLRADLRLYATFGTAPSG